MADAQGTWKEGKAWISSDGCRLGDAKFDLGDIARFESSALTFAPSAVYRIILLVLGFLALASAVAGMMTGSWLIGLGSTVMAIPLFWIAAMKSTRMLTVTTQDGRKIEYVGTEDHVRRVEQSIADLSNPDPSRVQHGTNQH